MDRKFMTGNHLGRIGASGRALPAAPRRQKKQPRIEKLDSLKNSAEMIMYLTVGESGPASDTYSLPGHVLNMVVRSQMYICQSHTACSRLRGLACFLAV